MINWIWPGLVLISILCAGFTGHIQEMMQQAFSSAREAVFLALGLGGVMTFWLGLTRIVQDGGFYAFLGRVFRRPLGRLFPEVPADHPALGAMLTCFGAGLLGLGDATIPLSVRAMKELSSLNPQKNAASNAMCRFVAIQASSLALLPIAVIGWRAASGSSDPASIWLPTLLVSAASAAAAVLAAALFQGLGRYRLPPVEAVSTEAPLTLLAREAIPQTSSLPLTGDPQAIQFAPFAPARAAELASAPPTPSEPPTVLAAGLTSGRKADPSPDEPPTLLAGQLALPLGKGALSREPPTLLAPPAPTSPARAPGPPLPSEAPTVLATFFSPFSAQDLERQALSAAEKLRRGAPWVVAIAVLAFLVAVLVHTVSGWLHARSIAEALSRATAQTGAVAGLLRALLARPALDWLHCLQSFVSQGLLPAVVGGVLVYGLFGKIRVYDSFVEGAREGIQLALRIVPALVAMVVAVGMFRASGGMDSLHHGLGWLTDPWDFPVEVLPLVLLRPVSEGGAMGYLGGIFREYGPDSIQGQVASVLQGGLSPIVALVALTFGAVHIQTVRHARAAGLAASLVGLLTAVLACHWFF